MILAQEGTIIKVTEGIYNCNVRITTPGIKIEPKEKDKPVYIIGNDGPTFTIDLPSKDDFVVIKKVLMAHSGINIISKFKEVQMGGALTQFDENEVRKANPKYVSEFDI